MSEKLEAIVEEVIGEARREAEEARKKKAKTVEPVAPTEPKDLDHIKFPKYGEVYEAKIVRIRRGRMADFYNIEDIEDPQLRKRLEEIANEPALEIWFEVPSLGALARDVIRITFHERSRLSELSRCYDELKLGDKVYVELKPTGKLAITCPPRR